MDSSKPKKINIYIAKRGRDGQLQSCLYYLNIANSKRLYEVSVFISSDTLADRAIMPEDYPNLYIHQWWGVEEKPGLFNKSKLLNNCIRMGNSRDWDWFSIVDLDMIYPENWFEEVETALGPGVDYLTCHGWLLYKEAQKSINERQPFRELLKCKKEELSAGPSQVTMTRKGYETLIKHFPEPIYNEDFKGWGGEDSVLDVKARALAIQGKLKKAQLSHTWLHTWHLLARGESSEYANNFKLYKELSAKIMRMRF